MILENLVANLFGRVRRETANGREYLVSPSTLIVPGVLVGSQGALYYPADEIAKTAEAWNGMPLTLGHPTANGTNVSARHPGVATFGHVRKPRIGRDGRLLAEAWFDVEATKKAAPEVLKRLQSGEPIELSTGLYTDNDPGDGYDLRGQKRYNGVARNYRPDHLAVLIDQKGACSVKDGCGVGVTENCDCPKCTNREVSDMDRDDEADTDTGVSDGDKAEMMDLVKAKLRSRNETMPQADDDDDDFSPEELRNALKFVASALRRNGRTQTKARNRRQPAANELVPYQEPMRPEHSPYFGQGGFYFPSQISNDALDLDAEREQLTANVAQPGVEGHGPSAAIVDNAAKEREWLNAKLSERWGFDGDDAKDTQHYTLQPDLDNVLDAGFVRRRTR